MGGIAFCPSCACMVPFFQDSFVELINIKFQEAILACELMADNQPSLEDDSFDRALLLRLGIIALSTLAGLAWGSVTSNTANSTGGFVGFLIGMIIVITVELAKTK